MKDIVTIAAILLGPIFAVQMQTFLERRRQSYERRLSLFRTLMAARVPRGKDVRYNEALNLIDIEFYSNKKVLACWRLYLQHLNNVPEPITDHWGGKFNDLYVDLLYEMGQSLKYRDLDKDRLKESYWPRVLADLENEQAQIRAGLLAVLAGKTSIPIHVSNPVSKMPPELPSAVPSTPTSGPPSVRR